MITFLFTCLFLHVSTNFTESPTNAEEYITIRHNKLYQTFLIHRSNFSNELVSGFMKDNSDVTIEGLITNNYFQGSIKFGTKYNFIKSPLYHTYRKRRSIGALNSTLKYSRKNICTVHAIVDHTFSEIFHDNIAKITKEILYYFEKASLVFRQTKFGQYNGYHFDVKNITIFTSSNKSNEEYLLSNQFIGMQRYNQLLTEMTMHDEKNSCLIIGFTNRDFEKTALGKAYGIAEIDNDIGICSSSHKNVAFVTRKNLGTLVSTEDFIAVLLHEIGHLFGSHHDKVYFKYLMNPIFDQIRKYEANEFSPASILQMRDVIEHRKDSCFKESHDRCGNGYVDFEEECDCGSKCNEQCCYPAGHENECKLKPDAQCSPSNGKCCSSQCQILNNTLCEEESDCLPAAYCQGTEATCRRGSSDVTMYNRKLCMDDTGTCYEGRCIMSLCYHLSGYYSCDCEFEAAPDMTFSQRQCLVCCRSDFNYDIPCRKISDIKEFRNLTATNKLVREMVGSFCGEKGFCDKYFRCREHDMNGPLQDFFVTTNFLELLSKHFGFVILLVIMMMILVFFFIYFCAVYSPTQRRRSCFKIAREDGILCALHSVFKRKYFFAREKSVVRRMVP